MRPRPRLIDFAPTSSLRGVTETGHVDFRFSSPGLRAKARLTLRPFLLAEAAERHHMVQRVGYFIIFLSLLIGGTAFLMWIAP